jgi:mono/diheme cytochrome c family protein
MKLVKWLLLMGTATLLAGTAFVYSGVYPMGADVPHTRMTYWLLETLRERSIARASATIQVPDLSSPDLLLSGGPDYNEMCAQCHLKPGNKNSDISLGLYPSPPNLSLAPDDHAHGHGADEIASAQRQFWIIKHGIKASGMPAWGPTHDDQRIWAMVAFIRKLPTLTPEQYQILTARESGESAHH